MQAVWNGVTIANAAKDELIYIEGNWYFPPSTVNEAFLVPSQTHTTCFWKGEASYYHIDVNGKTNEDAAWYYPDPKAGATQKVKQDFTDYIAFWRGVEVSE